MCTETFRRLPEEKRLRFLNAAWTEFTRVSFPEVSINQIVQKAGVPRGSFYQYFTDKEDLFRYLMLSVGDHFIGAYRNILQEMRGDLFRTQEEAFARFTGKAREEDPLFTPFLRLLHLNPAMSMRLITEGSPEHPILEQVRPYLDVSMLARQDDFFIAQVFHLALMTLVTAVRECMFDPDNTEEYHKAMLQRLEIVKSGCLRQAV